MVCSSPTASVVGISTEMTSYDRMLMHAIIYHNHDQRQSFVFTVQSIFIINYCTSGLYIDVNQFTKIMCMYIAN